MSSSAQPMESRANPTPPAPARALNTVLPCLLAWRGLWAEGSSPASPCAGALRQRPSLESRCETTCSPDSQISKPSPCLVAHVPVTAGNQ